VPGAPELRWIPAQRAATRSLVSVTYRDDERIQSYPGWIGILPWLLGLPDWPEICKLGRERFASSALGDAVLS